MQAKGAGADSWLHMEAPTAKHTGQKSGRPHAVHQPYRYTHRQKVALREASVFLSRPYTDSPPPPFDPLLGPTTNQGAERLTPWKHNLNPCNPLAHAQHAIFGTRRAARTNRPGEHHDTVDRCGIAHPDNRLRNRARPMCLPLPTHRLLGIRGRGGERLPVHAFRQRSARAWTKGWHDPGGEQAASAPGCDTASNNCRVSHAAFRNLSDASVDGSRHASRSRMAPQFKRQSQDLRCRGRLCRCRAGRPGRSVRSAGGEGGGGQQSAAFGLPMGPRLELLRPAPSESLNNSVGFRICGAVDVRRLPPLGDVVSSRWSEALWPRRR